MTSVLRFVPLLLLVLVVIGALIAIPYRRLGAGVEITATAPSQCVRIPGPPGPEDLQVDWLSGFAVISSVDRRQGPDAEGDLWVIELRDPGAEAVRLEGDLPRPFSPHGLSLFRDEGGLNAHVINHGGDRHSIERVRIDPRAGTVEHLATLRGSSLVSPNDIASVDAMRFYASNDHGTRGAFAQLLEDAYGLGVSDVVYFDGNNFRPVAAGLGFANGIALSADGSALYISETLGRSVNFYAREPVSGLLEPTSRIMLPAGADNIDVAADGTLWVTAHPNMAQFLSHAGDSAEPSPTVVYRFDPSGMELPTEVFLDSGANFSGGSVAAEHEGIVLMGGVFDAALMRCEGLGEGPTVGELVEIEL